MSALAQALAAQEAVLKGTVSRVGRYVRDTCQECGDTDVLVYDQLWDARLLCAGCSRVRSVKAPPPIQHCDRCDAPGAWRDPVTRRDEFFCAKCHGANGTVFQNRWAGARVSPVIGLHDRAKCTLAGYGTECKGEVKPRGGEHKGALICNKHAGKQSAGPEWHQ